jgi:hypothetical protein
MGFFAPPSKRRASGGVTGVEALIEDLDGSLPQSRGGLTRRTAVRLLKEFAALPQLVELDSQALPYGPDPRLADTRHPSLLRVSRMPQAM